MMAKPEKEISEMLEKSQNVREEKVLVDHLNDKTIENSLTMSTATKLSTDQLICKTPRESPAASVKSMNKDELKKDEKNSITKRLTENFSAVLCLSVLQILFGLLMVIFGFFVIFHKASLSQIGGGIWGGCLAIATGLAGVVAAAKKWCPLKETPEKVAHTVFLALSLISLAISQLVMVLAATGLARDMNSVKAAAKDNETATKIEEEEVFSSSLPSNYLAMLSNIGLLVICALECICSALASYKEARVLCPCFRSDHEDYNFKCDLPISNPRHALVSSWLGKHSPPPLYIVAAAPPSTLSSKRSKLSVTPVFLPPAMLQPPQIVGYPLIPAPLGPVPSPIIHHHHPHPRDMVFKKTRKYPKERRFFKEVPQKKTRSKPKEKVLTTEDVARTYTGLDRTIAEEFIEICDSSRNTSLCSDSSCQSSSCQSSCQSQCQCQSPCTAYTTTCTTSSDDARECLHKF